MKERRAIIERAKKLKADIELQFSTADHWNSLHPNEEPIDPDPDGQLKRMAAGIEKMLMTESACASCTVDICSKVCAHYPKTKKAGGGWGG